MRSMNRTIANVLIFVAGAGVGAGVTYVILNKKYERIIQEEVDSVKKTFVDYIVDKDIKSSDEQVERDWSEYEDLDVEEYDPSESDVNTYTELVSNYSGEEGGITTIKTRPYVISPYDFKEIQEYNDANLTYYADGTVELDSDQTVLTEQEVEEWIGRDSLYTFGEYEDDAVHVRNEYMYMDFEIMKDERTYEEVYGRSPSAVIGE